MTISTVQSLPSSRGNLDKPVHEWKKNSLAQEMVGSLKDRRNQKNKSVGIWFIQFL